MIADILKAITQNSNKEDLLTSTLQAQNETIVAQIQQIDDTIDSIDINDFEHIIQHYGGGSYNARTLADPLNQKIEILQQFYLVCASQEVQNKKHQLLIDEANQMTELSVKYDLVGTIALKNSQPDEPTMSFIKQQSKDLADELMNWQNQQNANKFHAEDGEMVPQYQHIIMFLDSFRKNTLQIYSSLVSGTYELTNTNFSITKQHFHTVWSEQQSFITTFISSLQSFLSKSLTYDINDRQYLAVIYEIEQNERKLRIYQKTQIVFDSSETSLHYEQIVISLTNLKNFFCNLQQLIMRQKRSQIQQLKKKTMQKIKQYFEYLIPYLKMDMRRKINSFFELKAEDKELSIYDLLVNLKISGQDAEIMVSTLHQIIKKVEANANQFRTIMKFIELAKEERRNYSMILFVSDQLISGLEELENINHDIVTAIRELLIVRQEMRMKIHSVEN